MQDRLRKTRLTQPVSLLFLAVIQVDTVYKVALQKTNIFNSVYTNLWFDNAIKGRNTFKGTLSKKEDVVFILHLLQHYFWYLFAIMTNKRNMLKPDVKIKVGILSICSLFKNPEKRVLPHQLWK